MTLKKLKVLFVSAEVSPFAKTGGLADVSGSLPGALAVEGNDVRVVMPRYRQINAEMKYKADFPVTIRGRSETCIIREGKLKYGEVGMPVSVPVYFIDSYAYFDRDGIYCFHDDGDRYAFFCKAVLQMLPKIGFKPDVIHCNDWHSGPICMLLKELYADDLYYKDIASLFTIHNLQYQGNFPADFTEVFGLPGEVFTPEKAEFYGSFSFMKTGIVYSDKVNTVSEKYAQEIQTPEYGENMEGILKARKKDLSGIVNGISYEEFNPETDKTIYKNFGLDSIEGKKENKAGLQKEMGLPVRNVPLLGIVSRLSGQKGLDLILQRAKDLFKNDLQFVLLGTGDPFYEERFKSLMNEYPEKISVRITFSADLAQKIYAGCDMFLMPSRYEPCGLGQIISLRYGTIPIVRATGGLAETITDYDADNKHGNGFSFTEFNAESFLDAVNRALKTYKDKDKWTELVRHALTSDYSWERSASKYLELYKAALSS